MYILFKFSYLIYIFKFSYPFTAHELNWLVFNMTSPTLCPLTILHSYTAPSVPHDIIVKSFDDHDIHVI